MQTYTRSVCAHDNRFMWYTGSVLTNIELQYIQTTFIVLISSVTVTIATYTVTILLLSYVLVLNFSFQLTTGEVLSSPPPTTFVPLFTFSFKEILSSGFYLCYIFAADCFVWYVLIYIQPFTSYRFSYTFWFQGILAVCA